MTMISNDWLDSIQGEFKKPYYKELYQFVREEYDTDFQNKVIGLLQEQTEYQRSIRNTMSGVLFILVLILIASGIVAFANFV